MNTTARLQDLLDRLNRGEEPAREGLITHSLGRVRELAQRMFRRQSDLRAQAETDDVLNNALVRLHRALAQVHPRNVLGFYGLAATQIRRVLLDLAREKGRSLVAYLPEPAERQAPTDEPSTLLEWAEFHERVAALPAEQREVVDVVFYQGLEQAEASDVLGVPLRTLKRRWREARLALAEAMQGRMPGEL